MTKQELEQRYSKALAVGKEMLEHAYKLDKLADENPDEATAIQQRLVATLFRQYYARMFE